MNILKQNNWLHVLRFYRSDTFSIRFCKMVTHHDMIWLTRSLASIFCPPRNHSTAMPSYDSSHSKVAVSPAVTVTSFRGRIRPMDRAGEKEEDDVVKWTSRHLSDHWMSRADLRFGSCQGVCEVTEVVLLLLQSKSSLSLQIKSQVSKITTGADWLRTGRDIQHCGMWWKKGPTSCF